MSLQILRVQRELQEQHGFNLFLVPLTEAVRLLPVNIGLFLKPEALNISLFIRTFSTIYRFHPMTCYLQSKVTSTASGDVRSCAATSVHFISFLNVVCVPRVLCMWGKSRLLLILLRILRTSASFIDCIQ